MEKEELFINCLPLLLNLVFHNCTPFDFDLIIISHLLTELKLKLKLSSAVFLKIFGAAYI